MIVFAKLNQALYHHNKYGKEYCYTVHHECFPYNLTVDLY
ncbi:hypothetical protein SAMN05216324_10585 [Chryseobacterium limigenitum]|uniref:Uncharacterized protein n=1 Tax=Chryseobacterium limigenitum TaxID=1612149 RepID=A0A1K2ILY9_9FLAO|nr:hypothetical protein SAMN05216324_10585 [Chryseobacterium limigenitum]